MTIHELLALTGLTESDEIPVWDAEASSEPTKKITAQNFASSIKTLASLLGTGDVVNNLTSTSTTAPLSANMGKALNDKIENTDTIIITGLSGTTIVGSTARMITPHLCYMNITFTISSGLSAWSQFITIGHDVANNQPVTIYDNDTWKNIKQIGFVDNNKICVREALAAGTYKICGVLYVH